MTTAPLLALAAEQFVLLTTFRRTGEAVATPVWVAQEGDRLVITTGSDSGKVKRLRHTERVELAACSASGTVRAGAVPVVARALVREDAETLAATEGVLKRKYGIQYRLIRAGQKLSRKAADSVALVITPAV